MNGFPTAPLSAEQQKKILTQMYFLIGRQIQSYHSRRHMGSNTSVPAELAQELLESIEYTVSQAGGAHAYPDLEDAFRSGQKVLEGKLSKAEAMMDLVAGTAPNWQTECRWEALRYLRHYLDQYDCLHLAHKGPEGLFYPTWIALPEDIQGIDHCLFCLNILWLENQIMAGIPEDILEQLWDRLPADTQNQCEHLLINGIGKILIGASLAPLTFEEEERASLVAAMSKADKQALEAAAGVLCQRIGLKDGNVGKYVRAILPQLTERMGENIRPACVYHLFI